MCTIALAWQEHSDFPLLVASNRDEFYARSASVPRLLGERSSVIAGLDKTHGGTWLGATSGGFFVGLTNQRTRHGVEARATSRGQVVLDALELGSSDAVDAFLEGLDCSQYNPFNLIYGDASRIAVAYARPDAEIEIVPLSKGVWVLSNDCLDSPRFPKAMWVKEGLVGHLQGKSWTELNALFAHVLSGHRTLDLDAITVSDDELRLAPEMLQALSAVCIHSPVYGTCSATTLACDAEGLRYYSHADGPPCVTDFVDYTPLLSERPSSVMEE